MKICYQKLLNYPKKTNAKHKVVRQLQNRLKSLGYYEGEITLVYDDKTEAAVKLLQKDIGITPEGWIGKG